MLCVFYYKYYELFGIDIILQSGNGFGRFTPSE